MIGHCISCLRDLKDVQEVVSGADLIFVRTEDLVTGCHVRFYFAWRNVFLAELFCRWIWNPDAQRNLEELLTEVLGPLSLLQHIRSEFEAKEYMACACGDDEAKYYLDRIESNYLDQVNDPKLFHLIIGRMAEQWEFDGFIPVCAQSKRGMVRNALLPFRFEKSPEHRAEVRYKGNDQTVHGAWTKIFSQMAKDVGCECYSVRLGVRELEVGQGSFALPVLMAWWRKSKNLSYNPMRVFATGAFSLGRLKEVDGIETKRKIVATHSKCSILISPSFNGKYGELQTGLPYVDVLAACQKILQRFTVSDYVDAVVRLWGERQSIDQIFNEVTKWDHSVAFFRTIGRIEKHADTNWIACLGRICSFINSQDGGVIVVGADCRNRKIDQSTLSEFAVEGLIPTYDKQRGEWILTAARESLLHALRLNRTGGWTSKTALGYEAHWEMAGARGDVIDLADFVNVITGEFRCRPVIILVVRPADAIRLPLSLRQIKRSGNDTSC